MNTAVAQRLLEKIRKFPKAFDMAFWTGLAPRTEDVPCGAVGCLAGHIVIQEDGVAAATRLARETRVHLHGMRDCSLELVMDGPFPQRAIEILDITKQQGIKLFFTEAWPREFRDRWDSVYSVYGSDDLAEDLGPILADRVEAFIEENS